MGPGALAQVLRSLTLPTSPNLLIGLDVKDDAAVYQIADGLALVQTVDFFPPIVDDPYTFGAIAAANALSDIYAMGGRPILALAIAGFPEDLPPTTISAILQGGADKVAEAAAEVADGSTLHSATDITGYGLLGHAAELARNSAVGLRIALERVPLLPGALDYARQGIFPGGLSRNREYLLSEGTVRLAEDLPEAHTQ